ncbi:MAG: rod shape determining protein RodA [Solirubrobacteraceae bacterium]|jgi:rod shape determining protein RodA|nr:rod shape determining protein RodA [Solirubrobacteraceae bacterium]
MEASAARTPIHRRVEEATGPSRPSLGIDPLLLLATLGLLACSIAVLASATKDDVAGSPYYYVIRQGVYAAIGLGLMIGLTRVDYTRLRELKYGLYGVMIGLIVLVIAVGSTARGSRRSFDLAFISFQPSEIGKLLLILCLSAFVVDRVRRLRDRDTTARAMLVALFPAMLVLLQPDLGTSLVYVVVVLAVLFVAGTPGRHFAALAAIGAVGIAFTLVAAPAIGVDVLKPYQKARLTAFLNPSADPANAGYQQNQSRIAIGAGQKTGRGDHATQTRLNFLPEHHTDFVFAVVGEEYGFLGASIVLSLFALLIWRGLRILTMAKNLYGALIAGGIVAMLMFQVFVNVGMTVGIMPITGVPLPLMSYGGSSVLMTLMAVGILQSIHVQSRIASHAKGRVPSL